MAYNYRVYTKATVHSAWKDTGIIESNKELADTVWTALVQRLRYHAYRLEPITYGIPIDRSGGRQTSA